MDTQEIETAGQYLKAADPLLGRLIERQQLQPRTARTDYFSSLCHSIIGQQVSVAAAAAIYHRLELETGLRPDAVAAIDDETVRRIGLSRQKAGYLRDLAWHFADNPALYDHLGEQSDDHVITELTAVKGIGVWTAQMFLMFTLGRPDVFAPDDGGLQRAMVRLYGWQTLPSKAGLIQTAEVWRPYRTVACLHLWQSLANTPL